MLLGGFQGSLTLRYVIQLSAQAVSRKSMYPRETSMQCVKASKLRDRLRCSIFESSHGLPIPSHGSILSATSESHRSPVLSLDIGLHFLLSLADRFRLSHRWTP
jgi:hypothetical protein